MTASDHISRAQFNDYHLTAMDGGVEAQHPSFTKGIVGQLLVEPHEGEVLEAYVSPDHRRKGVASAMLDLARTHASSRGLPPVRHSTALSNDGSAWASAKP